jgi:hypothetical protein
MAASLFLPASAHTRAPCQQPTLPLVSSSHPARRRRLVIAPRQRVSSENLKRAFSEL